MDISRLRSLFAPSLAALLVLLMLFVLAVQSPQSIGIRIPLLKLRPHDDHLICDDRSVVIGLLDDGTTKINENKIREEDLSPLVGEIMKTRAVRVIYVLPSEGIPYSRFVSTLGSLKKAAPAPLYIGVLMGEVRSAYLSHQLTLPCEVDWPSGDY
jgi:biopolymer transport protein ExbD